MFHSTVLQDDSRPPAMASAAGQGHGASEGPPSGDRDVKYNQQSKSTTRPSPLTLHRSSPFDPIRPSPVSPQPTLPSLSSTLFPRETPASSTYYDPTQDSAERPVARAGPSRYEPYPSERRDTHGYGDSRPVTGAAYDQSFHSPSAATFPPPPQLSPVHPPPPHHFTSNRSDTMPASPLSPKVHQGYNREHALPAFSSPARPVSRDTPSRKADPMSISSIMSGNDDPLPSYTKPVLDSRRSSRASNSHPPKIDRRSSPPPRPITPVQTHTPFILSKPEPLVNGHDSKTVEVNGAVQFHGKARPDFLDVEATLTRIDMLEQSDLETDGFKEYKNEYKLRSQKRACELTEGEGGKRKRRRLYQSKRFLDIFKANAEKGLEDYRKANEAKAGREVQAKEIAEEKERKKDMQRKRRREKALQNESQKRDEAVERAEQAADGEEKLRAIKDAQRHERKVRQTKKLLQGGTVSEDLREVTPHGPNLEGGVMSTIQMSDDPPKEPKKAARGGRTGARPRKSKEQKLAEKAQAAAAQAAIDRGDLVPAIAPKEAARLDKLEKVEKAPEQSQPEEPAPVEPRPYTSKAYNQLFDSIWKDIGKRDVGKVYRVKNESLGVKQSNLRKTAQLAGKEARRFQLRTNKSTKDVQARAKRSMREMVSFWRRNERDERDQRKVAERQELENAKRMEAEREANRQKRKLNFLISQTELYSHFIGKKVKTQEVERSTDDVTANGGVPQITAAPDIELPDNVGRKTTNFEDLDFDNEDESALQSAAMANAQNAIMEAQERAQAFNNESEMERFDEGEMNFQNPSSLQTIDIQQPKMLTCQLKEYQVKGLNWLVNLYEQGINGILADEMGLGKTVQSISVMSYLAENHNIWGPFLVIAPSSTLHNWQQEIAKFVPTLKVLPYWGSAKDRKVLRKFWDRKHITYRKESAFHVLVTSYQLVVQDSQYFQKIRWQYMILDEAQAIKSSSSSRWKSLLGFHCRNRLLLTGTPIQNNMQELWALLHFIMPTLFDSHDEFSDWFSKDIESHAQSNTKLNEDQLKRLHMILKPFMLRRIKKHVQKELGDKIELDVFCDLTYRQRAYYSNLRNKISLMDLVEKAAIGDDNDTATLMNLVMQFRKVCNHPDLFERADTKSPFSFSYFAETASFIREGNNVNVAYSVRNLIEYKVPRLVYRDSGRVDLPGPQNPNAGWRNKALNHMMNVFSPDNVAERSKENSAFSWLPFIDVSAGEVSAISQQGVFQRAIELRRKQELGQAREGDDGHNSVRSMFNVVAGVNRRPLADIGKDGRLASLFNISAGCYEQSGLSLIEPGAKPSASAPPIALDCSSQGANFETKDTLFNVGVRAALYGLTSGLDETIVERKAELMQIPTVHDLLPEPGSKNGRYTHISVPSMTRFVTDCGKLAKLDALLKELKAGGHRVLLYFQMTKMIDLTEEYLTYRNYKYCRLDGSTKLDDRRDTVADFQSKPDIFIFLLSTRAGGLGINLTSADTVIFYDSDWNPTIDSQAMDRAHRLGQTRQVTVYRLITRGTIEERIRKRALQKEEVQRVVISGQTSTAGPGGVVDFNSRSRDIKTKDIALWLADDDQVEEIERREKEALERGETGVLATKGRGKKRKLAMGGGSLEDMYHEGEGHFDDASAKPSGAATPVEGLPPKKKRISKKAKTAKQRLAIADGEA